MTEAEYNEALKELGVVLLDIDFTKLNTILDVAKIVIHLDKINERIILEDNDTYQKENEKLKAQLKVAEERIDTLSSTNIALSNQIEKIKIDNDKKLWIVSHQLEELLKLAKDKGIVKSWYTNGNYYWELAE